VTEAGLALITTTVITAIVHTLIPDHWLPFVLVSRAEGWTRRRTIALTSASGILHVTLSLALGLVILAAGRGAERAVSGLAETLEKLSGWMLLGFGLCYMTWFLLRGGHAHTFGIHPHHHPEDPEPSVKGRLGMRLKDLSGYTLTFVVGFNPCILLIPLVLGAAQLSPLTLMAVSAAFAVSTIASMVIVTLAGLRGTSRLTSPFLTRYGEALSGGLIAATGAAMLLLGG